MTTAYAFSWVETTDERYDLDRVRRISATVTDMGLTIFEAAGGIDRTKPEPRGDHTLIVHCTSDQARALTRALTTTVNRPVTSRRHREST